MAKKKVKIPNAIVHVKSTANNMFVTFTDESGNVIACSTPGVVGFKNAKKKNTPYAAQKATLDAINKVDGYGIENLKAFISGVSVGKDIALRTLVEKGFKITEITDITPVPHNGCRPPKKRRI